MSWDTASAKLRNVELDKHEQEIFMKRDDSFIVVDFDKGTPLIYWREQILITIKIMWT